MLPTSSEVLVVFRTLRLQAALAGAQFLALIVPWLAQDGS